MPDPREHTQAIVLIAVGSFWLIVIPLGMLYQRAFRARATRTRGRVVGHQSALEGRCHEVIEFEDAEGVTHRFLDLGKTFPSWWKSRIGTPRVVLYDPKQPKYTAQVDHPLTGCGFIVVCMFYLFFIGMVALGAWMLLDIHRAAPK